MSIFLESKLQLRFGTKFLFLTLLTILGDPSYKGHVIQKPVLFSVPVPHLPHSMDPDMMCPNKSQVHTKHSTLVTDLFR